MAAYWNHSAALELVDGDEVLLQDLIGIFFEDYPQHAYELKQGLARHDLCSVARTAHLLKGGLSYLGASAAQKLAAEIERSCQAENYADAVELSMKLLAELDALRSLMIPSSETVCGTLPA